MSKLKIALATVMIGICIILSFRSKPEADFRHGSFRKIVSYALFPILNETACLNGAFRGSVLVLNFNFDQFYTNIPVLYDMYDGVFGRIVTCGPEATKLVSEFKPDIVLDVVSGHFSYRCLGLAIEKYPGYEGYFYGQDDMIINWWNLVSLNRKKIWQGVKIVDFRQNAYEAPIINWIWWSTPMGLRACQNYYDRLRALQVTDAEMPPKVASALSTYLQNGQGAPRCGKGWSDFFYIPGSEASAYSYLSKIAYDEGLYLEIAVNNILRSLSGLEDLVVLDGLYLPDIGVRENNPDTFWNYYSTRLSTIHPFKLHLDRTKQLQLLKANVVRLKEFLLRC